MELLTLGTLALRGSAFTERKPLLLLAYLALRGRRARGDVAEAFWPDADPELRRKSLSEALRKLRKLGPDAVLEPAPDALATGLDCDAVRLAARAAAAPGDDGDAAARGLHGAYPAPFLHGLESDRRLRLGATLAEWILETREELHAAVVDALLRCAERLARRGAFRRAAELAEGIAALPDVPAFPSPDELQRHHALLLAGNRHAAAAVVAARARDAYGDLGLPSDPAAARASLDVRRALPPLPPHFGGRDQEGEALLQRLRDPAVRALQLCGHPGVGKSALAAAVAARARTLGAFPGGVAFVALDALEPGSDERRAGEFLAAALALDPARGDASALARSLGDAPQLLVLDAAERLAHLPDLPAALARHSGATLLLTSRVRLDLDGAPAVALEGLAHGASADAPAAPTAAEQLFRAVATERGARLTDTDATAVRRVASAVEGNPLALRLAAGWSASVPVTEIAERLERSWELLAGTPLERALADVRRDLSDSERRALLRIGAQRGGFAAADADALGIDISALRGLVSFDLLRFDPERRRYTQHAVVEREAAQRLAEHPDAEAIRDRHARHYLTRLAELISEDPEVRNAAPRGLFAETTNIETAMRRAVVRRWWTALAAAAHPLERLAELNGRPRWAAALLAGASKAIGAADVEGAIDAERGAIDASRAWLALLTGEYDLGLRLANAARDRLERDAEHHPTALRTALHAAGAIHDERGAFDQAAELFERALGLAPPDSPETATTLLNLGVNARFRGAYDESAHLLRRALTIYRSHHREAGVLEATSLLADALRLDGEPLAAIAELDGIASLLERSDTLEPRIQTFLSRAEAELALERTDAATASLQRARNEGSDSWEADLRIHVLEAHLALHQDDARNADRHARAALTLACERRAQHYIGLALSAFPTLHAPVGEGAGEQRRASLLGFLRHLAERSDIRAEVLAICVRRFAGSDAWQRSAPPPWTEAALGEPAILLERTTER